MLPSHSFVVRVLGILALVLELGSSAGCRNDCKPIALASVSLTVSDAQTGEPIRDAVITFTVDDEPEERPAEREHDGHYVLTWEEDGTFDVRIEAPGYLAAEREYVVEAGDCNVEGVSEEVALEPAP